MRRRWPYYELPVGQWFVIESPPKCFRNKVHTHAAETGKLFRVRRVDRRQPNGWYQVKRVA